MTKEMKKLKEACEPLLKLLNDADHHPHMTVIVTATSIELVEGVCSIPNDADHHPHMMVIITATSIELVEGVCSIPKIYEFIKD